MMRNKIGKVIATLTINRKVFELQEGFYTIGKDCSDQTHDIPINDPSVDVKHATLIVSKSQTYVLDMLSKKGSFINNVRVGDLEKMLLENIDLLRFGNVQCMYERIGTDDSILDLIPSSQIFDVIPVSPEHSQSKVLIQSGLSRLVKVNKSDIFSTAKDKSSKVDEVIILDDDNEDSSFLVAGTQAIKNAKDSEISKSLNAMEDDDDEFFIPETQDILDIIENNENELEQNENELEQNEDLIRIDTQVFEDSFKEKSGSQSVLDVSMLIPFVEANAKHNSFIDKNAVNSGTVEKKANRASDEPILEKNSKNDDLKETNIDVMLDSEYDAEMSALNSNDATNLQNNNPKAFLSAKEDEGELRSTSVTPDLEQPQFEEKEGSVTPNLNLDNLFENDNNIHKNNEAYAVSDYLLEPTQVFQAPRDSNISNGNDQVTCDITNLNISSSNKENNAGFNDLDATEVFCAPKDNVNILRNDSGLDGCDELAPTQVFKAPSNMSTPLALTAKKRIECTKIKPINLDETQIFIPEEKRSSNDQTFTDSGNNQSIFRNSLLNYEKSNSKDNEENTVKKNNVNRRTSNRNKLFGSSDEEDYDVADNQTTTKSGTVSPTGSKNISNATKTDSAVNNATKLRSPFPKKINYLNCTPDFVKLPKPTVIRKAGDLFRRNSKISEPTKFAFEQSSDEDDDDFVLPIKRNKKDSEPEHKDKEVRNDRSDISESAMEKKKNGTNWSKKNKHVISSTLSMGRRIVPENDGEESTATTPLQGDNDNNKTTSKRGKKTTQSKTIPKNSDSVCEKILKEGEENRKSPTVLNTTKPAKKSEVIIPQTRKARSKRQNTSENIDDSKSDITSTSSTYSTNSKNNRNLKCKIMLKRIPYLDPVIVQNVSSDNNSRKRQSEKSIHKKNKKSKKNDLDKDVTNKKNESTSSAEKALVIAKNTDSEETSSKLRRSSRTQKPKIVFTKIDPSLYAEDIERIGATVVDNPMDCTVLITDSIVRTWKFLSALAKGVPIVTTKWLTCYNETIVHDDFLVNDQSHEKKFKCQLSVSLKRARKRLIFEGYTFYVTKSTLPTAHEIKNITKCGGGRIVNSILPEYNNDEKFFIISHKKDKPSWKEIKRILPAVKIVSTEGFMISVLQQKVNFDDYLLLRILNK